MEKYGPHASSPADRIDTTALLKHGIEAALSRHATYAKGGIIEHRIIYPLDFYSYRTVRWGGVKGSGRSSAIAKLARPGDMIIVASVPCRNKMATLLVENGKSDNDITILDADEFMDKIFAKLPEEPPQILNKRLEVHSAGDEGIRRVFVDDVMLICPRFQKNMHGTQIPAFVPAVMRYACHCSAPQPVVILVGI